MVPKQSVLAVLCGLTLVSAQNFTAPVPSYTATYLPANVPNKTEQGQLGYNNCGNSSSQDSLCQDSYLNAWNDFCVWAPPSNTSSFGNSSIGNTERFVVSWCLKSGYGTRLIPKDTVTGAHFVITPNYVQITGVGRLTSMNIPDGDEGGELDPHGSDGLGNPIGGLFFGSANKGVMRQYHEWIEFISYNTFCARICIDQPGSTQYCEHIYDVMGCLWNMPGNYSDGFSSCHGDSTEPMGLYVANGTTSTFHQGQPTTPLAHPAGASSSCTYFASLNTKNNPSPSPSSGGLSTTSSNTNTITTKPSVTSTGSTARLTSTTKAGDAPARLAVMFGWGTLISTCMLFGASLALL
ncbi:uncharacterized protein EI90DRAFT_2624412 [Cantharellus anzutake]|uniref:uncharacterized protein n=1 Tax=Cantharellus anzutake TaxID=1750568 RepID=UPI001902CCF7|nr:uncharacterized protein EI90DRAFT_2624412 [Cantharellus anzutake]KAF8319825.1 hypothetical protein EI90DRAFT_2624412 [Cantharellus anzutake]